MANEKFWLIFPDESTIKYEIDEPINFRQVDFNLDRKEDGHALDVSLSGGKINFRFTDQRNHYLEKILYYNHIKGFEANVLLGFKLETGEEFLAEFDFYTAITNDYNYFECSMIVQSQTQIFKRRYETKVDLFSDIDINGNTITPLQPINMLLQAKPSSQVSQWEQTSIAGFLLQGFITGPRYINTSQNLIKSEIKDSYTFFETSVSIAKIDSLKCITAQSNLSAVEVSITNLKALLVTTGGGSSSYVIVAFRSGNDFNSSPETILYDSGFTGSSLDLNLNLKGSIDSVKRNESIWVYLKVYAGTGNFYCDTMEMSITAESVAYNSVFPTFRLIDAMRQVSKSISGLDVYAPRYDVNGEFYDTILTNGNLLRNIKDKPFYISWEDIEKSIVPEHNADSEIMINGKVFVGIEKDFYRDSEDGFFDNTQFSGMVKNTNPEFALNKFVLKYSKYQSLKENTEPNSESTIHGESHITPYNQKVENSKENSIEWVRDAILLDVQQRLSTKVSEDTATQEDDTIFAIDTVTTESDRYFVETTTIQHTALGDTQLSFRTNGEVNFIVLGVTAGSLFKINAPDPNAGDYIVQELFNTELRLNKVSGNFSGGNNGIRLTKYVYEIKKDDVPLTNRTNEGFSLILNLSTQNRYSNLRYSVERNIRNYWNSFLATVNMYWAEKPLKNTYYKNNGTCETEYNGLRIIEKEDFIPTDPIVTPVMYEDVVFANVEHSEFLELQTKLRNRHGYIRTIDNNRRVLKLYVLNMSYDIENKQLTITGKERFEKSYLEIIKNGSTVIVNGETFLTSLKYEVDEGNKIILLDAEDERLYNGIYWNKVTVNGQNATTLNILKTWLDLLK